MKKTTQLGLILVILLAGFGIWTFTNFKKNTPNEYVVEVPVGTYTLNATTGEATPGAKKFTLADIATHKDTTSCYVSIQGSVYDLTAWINLHPGGRDKIIMICGKDGTELFMKKHKGAQKFMDILARYKIGLLS